MQHELVDWRADVARRDALTRIVRIDRFPTRWGMHSLVTVLASGITIERATFELPLPHRLPTKGASQERCGRKIDPFQKDRWVPWNPYPMVLPLTNALFHSGSPIRTINEGVRVGHNF
jgi:hypothetical protein